MLPLTATVGEEYGEAMGLLSGEGASRSTANDLDTELTKAEYHAAMARTALDRKKFRTARVHIALGLAAAATAARALLALE